MTELEFDARMGQMFDAQYKALGIDMSFPGAVECSEEIHALAMERFSKQIAIEAERNPSFKHTLVLNRAKDCALQYAADHRPIGEYREDGILPLDGELMVFMSWATREYLLAWALHEDDERNLAYIKGRLDLWDSHPECKTLAELETWAAP